MKWGWYWTTGSSAFQRYHPSILIQPSSLCCLLPSQAMELCPEPEWLLLQILCWKAWPIGSFGQTIEFWVSTQRCVCAGGLACSRRGDFRCLSRRGCEERQEGQEHAQEGQDAKALARMAIRVRLEGIMNMNILEDQVASLLSSLSS